MTSQMSHRTPGEHLPLVFNQKDAVHTLVRGFGPRSLDSAKSNNVQNLDGQRNSTPPHPLLDLNE